MVDMIAHYSRRATAAGLLLLFCGCQSWSNLKARFAPPPPGPSSPLTAGAEPAQPLTKAQKLDMQMAVARISENDGNLDEAIKNYSEVLKKDANRVEASHRIAILYDLKGQPEKSRGYYLEAIRKTPDNAELYCDFGYSCYLQRNWAEAEENLRKAVEINPELARAHVNLGMLLGRTRRSSAALREFAQAGLGEAAARSNLALAHVQENRWMEAQEEYSRALAVDPNSKTAKLGLAAVQAQGLGSRQVETQLATQPRTAPAVQPQSSVAAQTRSPQAVLPEPAIATPPQAPPAAPAQRPVLVEARTPPAVTHEPNVAPQPAQLPQAGALAVQELPKPQPEPQIAAKPQALPATEYAVTSPTVDAERQLAEQSRPQVLPADVPLQTPAAVRADQPTNMRPPAIAELPPAQQEQRAIAPPQPLPPVEPEQLAAQTGAPSAGQAETKPVVSPLPPTTEQAEAPAAAPAQIPDEEAAPVPPVRPPVETVLRGTEETSPDARRY
jgi:tetratricopeptide (TPR) repeat protein